MCGHALERYGDDCPRCLGRETQAVVNAVRPLISSIALVVANLIPLWGVLYRGWDVFLLVFLYWAENLVVGFFNLLRMAAAHDKPSDKQGKVFLLFFFPFHYGMFCLVHGVFVFTMFGATGGIGPLARLQHSGSYLLIAFAGLFISHAVSYVFNFLGQGEYQRVSAQELMMRPYGRIVVLHLTIIFGGMLVMTTGTPVMGLLFLLGIKTVLDLIAHWKERGKFAGAISTDDL